MELSLKTVTVVAILLLVCSKATASEITHDWTIGGWQKNGIGLTGFRHGDGTVDTEFRYGCGVFDCFRFPIHIYGVVVVANLPFLVGIAFFLMCRYRRRYDNAA